MTAGSASDVDAILREVFGPPLEERGFVPVRRRAWVRSEKPHIRDLFELQPLKHGTPVPIWGFSLDFVPHLSGRRLLRWHRTPKSARFDLRYDPMDYAKTTFGWTVREGDEIPVEETRKSARHLMERVVPMAVAYWDSVQVVGDLPAAFQDKRERPAQRFGFESYVYEVMAEAFVAAALGDPRSRELFEAWAGTYEVDPVAAERLRERLEALLEAPLDRPSGAG